VVDEHVSSTDLFPTILAAAKITKPEEIKIDGISILSHLLIEPEQLELKASEGERLFLWFKDLVSIYFNQKNK